MKTKKKKADKSTLELLTEAFNDRFNPFAGHGSAGQYKYDTYLECQNGSNCCDNDYCRCGVIENARVTSVDIDACIRYLTKDLKDVFMSYCVDRVLRISKVMDVGSWEVNISGGYCGEEVHGATLNSKILSDVTSQILEMASLTPIEKVKKLLEYEYGYVLPRLEKFNTAEIKDVALDEIKLFNDEYLRKISKETVDYYKDYTLPRGVCVKNRNAYSVIDGYHRMLSAQKNKQKTVSVIVMSE